MDYIKLTSTIIDLTYRLNKLDTDNDNDNDD